MTTIQLKLIRSRGGWGGVGTIADKDEDKDVENVVDENKDLMKNDSVQLLSYRHLPTPKLPTSVALPMSNLAELINNVTSSSSSSALSLSLLWNGWVDMNLMKHNLVERGLAEYKAVLLYLLGRIMSRGKGYTIRGGAAVTTMVSEDCIKQKLVARVPRSQPGK